jgi:hypothetical protein
MTHERTGLTVNFTAPTLTLTQHVPFSGRAAAEHYSWLWEPVGSAASAINITHKPQNWMDVERHRQGRV